MVHTFSTLSYLNGKIMLALLNARFLANRIFDKFSFFIHFNECVHRREEEAMTGENLNSNLS
jgi:hypothetical protein